MTLPRVTSLPEGATRLGEAAVKLAATAGLVLDPWQALVVTGGCRTRPGGLWSAREVGLIVPRQNGKGAVTEARELAGLFLFGERLILHSAHEFKTAKNAYERIRDTIRDAPHLNDRVRQWRYSNEEVSIELNTGAKLRFVARSSGSGRGFSADCIVLDESFELSDAALGALMPTLSARPNPQIWYTSTPSTPTSNGEVLTRVRDRGRAGVSTRLAYFEWSADPDSVDLDDPEVWAQANPALGIRLSEDSIAAEREAMAEADFLRERLGVWDDSRMIGGVVPRDFWVSAGDEYSMAVDRFALGVECGPDLAWASVGLAGQRADGLWHVELDERRDGVAWVVPYVKALCAANPQILGVVADAGSPSAALFDEFTKEKVQFTAPKVAELGGACAQLLQGIVVGSVRHIRQPQLDYSVSVAGKRPLGDTGMWVFSRRTATADITPVQAVNLALWGAQAPPRRLNKPLRGAGRVVGEGRRAVVLS